MSIFLFFQLGQHEFFLDAGDLILEGTNQTCRSSVDIWVEMDASYDSLYRTSRSVVLLKSARLTAFAFQILARPSCAPSMSPSYMPVRTRTTSLKRSASPRRQSSRSRFFCRRVRSGGQTSAPWWAEFWEDLQPSLALQRSSSSSVVDDR